MVLGSNDGVSNLVFSFRLCGENSTCLAELSIKRRSKSLHFSGFLNSNWEMSSGDQPVATSIGDVLIHLEREEEITLLTLVIKEITLMIIKAYVSQKVDIINI